LFPDPAFQVRFGSDPDSGFCDQKILEKNAAKFFFPFFDQKLQFIYPLASIKDLQAKGKALIPPKRTSST
jgi:hypothetical protein